MDCAASLFSASASRGTAARVRPLLGGLLLIGCASFAAGLPPLDSELIGREGLLGGERFFLRYETTAGDFYTGGNWSERIDLRLNAEQGYAGPYIVPLEYHRSEPWPDLPAAVIPVRILPVQHWNALKNRLFEAFLPDDPQAGIVVNFNLDDYFLYRDPDGSIHSVTLRERPRGFRIADTVSIVRMLEYGRPVTDAYLADQGISDRRLVWDTGDTGLYSLPFLYMNLDLQLAIFGRLEPGPGTRVARPPVVPVTQTIGHLAQSHLGAMAIRPVSSLKRLFFVLTDTAVMPVKDIAVMTLPRGPVPPLAQGRGMDLDAWEDYLTKLTGRPASSGTLEYLVDGSEFFPRLIDTVESAQESVHMRTYIFDNDDFAASIGELLKDRSRDGVDVRVLLDGLGTIMSTTEQQASLPRDHRGADSVRRFLTADSSVLVRQAPNPWMTGDHVKTTVVDKQIAYLGGMNIAREYRYDWHDLMMEVRGPVVRNIQNEFDDAWVHAGWLGDVGWFFHKLGGQQKGSGVYGYPIRLLHTRPGVAEILRAQQEAIQRAKRYIYVENAYFTDDTLLHELIRARHRGVDVRVIVPLVSDRGALTRDNALAANAMLENGVRVFIYPGMSHVKAAVYDGWACVGSANFDRWSLKINREMNVSTSDPESVEELLERVFQADFDRSPELLEPFPERWSDHLFEVLGDYIF